MALTGHEERFCFDTTLLFFVRYCCYVIFKVSFTVLGIINVFNIIIIIIFLLLLFCFLFVLFQEMKIGKK